MTSKISRRAAGWDADTLLDSGEREALLERVRSYQQAAAEQVEKLRVQLAQAEDFEAALRSRLDSDTMTTQIRRASARDAPSVSAGVRR